MPESTQISIVVPVFNEEENLQELNRRLLEVMDRLKRSFEIIYVDDHSADKSFAILNSLAESRSEVRLVRFKKNFGQTAAIMAGFRHASGEVVVTLDADLQNDPADIPLLLDKIAEGNDVVSGWRHDRQDPFLRSIVSRSANYIIRKISGVELHDFGCTLKAYRREIVKNLHLYGDMHRFVPIIASQQGAQIAELKVRHHPRLHGESKYNMSRISKVFIDLFLLKFLTSYYTRPIQMFGRLALWVFTFGILLFGYVVGMKLFVAGHFIVQNPLFLVSVFCMIVAIQLISVGILGEINIRTYFEGLDKPTYTIEKARGFEDAEKE